MATSLIIYLTIGCAWALWNMTSRFAQNAMNENPEYLNILSFLFAVALWPPFMMLTVGFFIARWMSSPPTKDD